MDERIMSFSWANSPSMDMPFSDTAQGLRASPNGYPAVLIPMAVGIDLYNQSLPGDESKTLNTIDHHAVCYAVYDARGNGRGGCVPTLTGDHENRVTDYTTIAVIKNESLPNENRSLMCEQPSR